MIKLINDKRSSELYQEIVLTKSDNSIKCQTPEFSDVYEWGLAIIDSKFIDPGYLLDEFGLTLSDRTEFAEIYAGLEPSDRPNLTPFFDRKYYETMNPDVIDAGLDPLYHFVRWGISERRAPHPLVSVTWIFDDLSETTVSKDPIGTLLDIILANVKTPNPYFDIDYYKEQYSIARSYQGGALKHYLECGDAIVSRPNAYFDPDWYQTRYSDLVGGPVDLFIHFVIHGDGEYRIPSTAFDPEWYAHAYPDIKINGYPPLYHFLWHGRAEGRNPTNPRELKWKLELSGLALERESHEPPSPQSAEERYARLKELIARQKQRRIEAFQEVDVRPCVIDSIEAGFEGLAFRRVRRPRISIIIPCHDQLLYTLECLHALVAAAPSVPFEVIVADDASPDPAVRRLREVPGLRYIRTERNVGFLKNCNAAFKQSRGQFVLLLNNDAQILPGAIEALAEVLESEPDVAAVGPKILYPNGRLQEAGCALNADGTTTMVGLFEDPDQPAYNWRRDVHACSGAGLMVRRACIQGPLFDERFAPAYCEDMDLCLQLIADGHRVVYEPAARLVHHLSVSMNVSTQSPKLQKIVRNQQRLVEKWSDLLERETRVRVLAFYLPQFHPVPENDLWWGAGFTEWTNVTAAKPSYSGHYQPHLPADLGFYDLRVPETLAKQAELAARYGIEGFCVYYYNFDGKRVLEQPLEIILKNPDIPFKFCICWANENWSRRWDGGDQEVLLAQSDGNKSLPTIIDDLVKYTNDPRYIRINGRPVVVVYRPLLMDEPKKTIESIREFAIRAGVGDLYLIYVESMETIDQLVSPKELGFDASVEFPPQGIGVPAQYERKIIKPKWSGLRYDYEKTVAAAVDRVRPDYKRYPAVFPGWDNTARQPVRGTSFDGASPEAFYAYLEEKLKEAENTYVGDERLLFVNAWNEWAEGAHLEPDRMYGHRWLETIGHCSKAIR